jgi:gamma-glutamyl-gamma-aminobutyrate hydrolase PuuD
MRDREDNQVRQDHEEYILRQALQRGQPVLALCAGSWRLWQALWSINLYPDYKIDDQKRGHLEEMLKFVTDHSASRMMSLSQTNPKVCYNIMMHGLQLQKDSLLYGLLTYKVGDKFIAPPDNIQVNSVHWKAPQLNPRLNNSQGKCPFGIDVAATSKNTARLDHKNRSGRIMEPEEEIIEAFSSFYGAPVIGIGWHPEASNKTDDSQMFPQFNHALIRKMAKAGQAYHYKRRVLRELMGISLAARLD